MSALALMWLPFLSFSFIERVVTNICAFSLVVLPDQLHGWCSRGSQEAWQEEEEEEGATRAEASSGDGARVLHHLSSGIQWSSCSRVLLSSHHHHGGCVGCGLSVCGAILSLSFFFKSRDKQEEEEGTLSHTKPTKSNLLNTKKQHRMEQMPCQE